MKDSAFRDFFQCFRKSLPLYCVILVPVLLLLIMHVTTGCSILWFLGTFAVWIITVLARTFVQFFHK